MTQPDVTVVVPVYNRGSVVGDAVASIVRQDVPARIVLVDDGSSDDTLAVLTSLAETSGGRVSVVAQDNAGPAAARNAGVAASSTELVTFLDSDDLMEPGRLQRQIDAWREAPGQVVVIGHERVEIAPGVEPPDHIATRMSTGQTLYHTSVLLSRAQYDAVGGFDDTMRLAEDVDFLIRLEEAGNEVVDLGDVVITRRILGDNLVYDPAVGRSLFLLLRRRAERARESGRR
ncbi:glycosyl transferase family 2 [Ilumatobacter fluminis]|uniref:Glycosyl transferase family 2 n=1 Tax=Ilumatobacter fluminis TaxID=467091 RepID=A0A4R7HYN5_9ACTN|nr:glycosyltransferase family A protein [Ilumatobacter fluminis]TDT15629.1 glycosyl transferase family 2 [Ilumatobacter fluminis]